MIVTVTCNPALDYVMTLPALTLGALNRADREELQVGGKGLNVSLILKELGLSSLALGFLAGDTGELLRRRLETAGVETDFVTLPAGMTRINVKIKGEGETELNGQGPSIPPSSLEELLAKLDRLQAGDTLVLSGSIPSSLPEDTYERVLKRLEGKEVRTVVDAAGALLERVLPFRPFLIKPNHLELGELVGEVLDPTDTPALVKAAQALQKEGAQNVLVSLASHGALLVSREGEVYRQSPAPGEVQNSVGAGDSMVAGFLAGLERGYDLPHALRLGAAAGGATAFSPRLATQREIHAVYQQMKEEG